MQLFDRIGDLHSQMYGGRTAEKREYTFFREVYAGFVGHPPAFINSRAGIRARGSSMHGNFPMITCIMDAEVI